MIITCRKLSCIYNKGLTCGRKNLHIDRCLDCDMFKKNKKQKYDISKTMYEIAPEIAPYTHIKECNINCDARCIFNDKGKCMANGITINEKKDSCPGCMTFIDK
jgi:hypothetical protein